MQRSSTPNPILTESRWVVEIGELAGESRLEDSAVKNILPSCGRLTPLSLKKVGSGEHCQNGWYRR